jgi:hypothetical protein
MNARLTWSLVAGVLLVGVLAVFAVYGTHAFTIAGRLGLAIF